MPQCAQPSSPKWLQEMPRSHCWWRCRRSSACQLCVADVSRQIHVRPFRRECLRTLGGVQSATISADIAPIGSTSQAASPSILKVMSASVLACFAEVGVHTAVEASLSPLGRRGRTGGPSHFNDIDCGGDDGHSSTLNMHTLWIFFFKTRRLPSFSKVMKNDISLKMRETVPRMPLLTTQWLVVKSSRADTPSPTFGSPACGSMSQAALPSHPSKLMPQGCTCARKAKSSRGWPNGKRFASKAPGPPSAMDTSCSMWPSLERRMRPASASWASPLSRTRSWS
mmetsp:Transcript_77882/g.223173  ORF Transcript_77882/g.223173 Transcript_77882/m.223173 type:complete len:282 (+) Transcript_77882:362-1207(+)